MKKFRTSKEGIEFFEDFTFRKASQMSDYYYEKLEKAWELEGNYKKKNEILWDMFSDWESVIGEIGWEIHMLSQRADLQSEKDKVDYLNDMLERYDWYLQYN